MISLLLFVGVIVAYLVYFYKNLYWRKRGVPYKTPLPIVGNLLPVFLGRISFPELTKKIYFQYRDQPYFGMFGLDKPMLMIRDPEMIKRILIKDFSNFNDRNFLYDENTSVISSNNLFIMKNPEWKTVRSKLSPVFTSGRMKLMFPLMKECALDLENAVEKLVGTTVETRELSACYLTDVICSCVFGIKANTLQNQNGHLREAVSRLAGPSVMGFIRNFTYMFAHGLARLLKLGSFDGEAVEFLRNVFIRTINDREAKGNTRNDLIDIFIEIKNKDANSEGYQLFGDRLVGQAFLFISAGHEPSAAIVSYALLELAIQPDLQDRLREEIRESIREYHDVTYESIQGMKYLDMVVNETLRKYPFTTSIQRECASDYKLEETGLVIEKGTTVYMPLFGLHADPDFYPDPEKFDPERFSDENKGKIINGTYLPFGDGPRNCIGTRFGVLSTKLGIIYFLNKYEVLKAPTTQEKIKLDPRSPLSFPIGGIPLKFRKIET